MDITTIRIKHIPALFPDIDFEDVKYILSNVIKTPENNTIINKTEKYHKTIDHPATSLQLIAQTINYNQYQLEFEIQEYTNIDITKIAEQITIITQNKETLNIQLVESPTYEALSETYNYKVTLKFIEIQPDEYTISNYLTSDYLLKRYKPEQLYRIELSNNINLDKSEIDFVGYNTGTISIHQNNAQYFNTYWLITISKTSLFYKIKTNQTVSIYTQSPPINNYIQTDNKTATIQNITQDTITIRINDSNANIIWNTLLNFTWVSPETLTFYTKIIPRYYHTESEIKEDKQGGIKYTSNIITSDAVELTFYFTERELYLINKYLSRCFYYNFNTPQGTKYFESNNPYFKTAIEYCIPEYKENDKLIGIYEVTVKLKYTKYES